MQKNKRWYDVSYLTDEGKTWVPFAMTDNEDKAIDCIRALMHLSYVKHINISEQELPQEFERRHA